MNVVVYCGSTFGTNPRFREEARALGRWIGESGNRLVYGGSSVGLMGVEQHDLTNLFVVQTMAERKTKMIELGDVFVALPGGVGTLEEISEIASRVRLGLGQDACYLLNVDGFYEPLKAQLALMEQEGFLSPEDAGRYRFVSSVGELVGMITSS